MKKRYMDAIKKATTILLRKITPPPKTINALTTKRNVVEPIEPVVCGGCSLETKKAFVWGEIICCPDCLRVLIKFQKSVVW